MTFFVMNLACFLLKIGSAPNFRPSFKFFTWQSAFVGSILSAAAMFFIDETYASTAVCLLVFLFLLIHYLSPPKHWGDVSQNLIYHQVRKYLLRLKPEHIKFWRPQILLLINDPRKHIRLVQFCNSMKKGGLYILGHVIVTDDFTTGVHEAKTQQAAWTRYISEYSRIKAFMQLTMSPTITWGIRNLILSSGLGGLRPNIAVLGFYNMEELRGSQPLVDIPDAPKSPGPTQHTGSTRNDGKSHRRRGDTTSRLVEGFLPTDVIRTEGMMDVKSYMTILEDLALRYQLNVAVGKGFDALEPPRKDGHNGKKYIDLWPIQMALEVEAEGKNVLAWNWQTYTLILQLGYVLRSVPAWKKAYRLRVLAFVEYESEVEVERERVKALLEKLRIEAEVLVFWLACGQLSTYDMIIHGRTTNPETAMAVNNCLKDDEWWAELQQIRGSRNMTASQELLSIDHMFDSISGRAGRHSLDVTSDQTSDRDRRRPSVALLTDLPKKSTISQLAHLGINMGIRTQNLPTLNNVFDNSDAETLGDSDSESDGSEGSQGDFNDAASEGDVEDVVRTLRRPLLMARSRSKSHGDILTRSQLQAPRRRVEESKGKKIPEEWKRITYGTISSPDAGQASIGSSKAHLRSKSGDASPDRSTRRTVRPAPLPLAPARTSKPDSQSGSRVHSRHGSSAIKFSSHLVPETRIMDEDGSEPRIMFAHSDSTRSERPDLPRRPSSGRLLSKLAPDKGTPGEQGVPSRSVSFAELQEARSKPGSMMGDTGQGDAQVDIATLLGSGPFYDGDGGSSYSTQGLPLSFNDLPSRAQHLILNELLRQNSQHTAVLYTTLPIPQEGTCQSEEASIQYLSDIEVLCTDLPPVLLVLSNNATVTVGL
jgi:potassium/chloride transporter 9